MMNSALTEMFHCVNALGNFTGNGGRNRTGTKSAEMEELEQDGARMKWKQEQFQQTQLRQQQVLGYFDGQSDQVINGLINSNDQSFGELMTMAMKPDPGLKNDWSTLGMNCSISCPPTVAPDTAGEAVPAGRAKDNNFQEKLSSTKRKADKNQNLQVVAEEEHKDENMKECTEEGDSKETTEQKSKKRNTNSNNNYGKETSGTSKEKSKITDDKKTDYIHVRARRGQATDSHSLAERVRREKISERMKYLQDLVPGCNKITGKAGMLDEIINYVQSLQRQVEFLSMKLAAVNPRLDFNTDNFFDKEIFAASTSNFGAVGAAASSEMFSLAQRQFNSLQQVVSCSGYEMGNVNPSDMSLRRTTSAPQSIPETHLDPSNINQVQSFPTWDSELQSLYGMELQQGKLTQFLHQPFTGFVEVGSDLKMET